MACRRSLTTKAFLLRRWYCPSLSHIVHRSSESDENLNPASSNQPTCGITNFVLPQIYIQGSNRSSGGLGVLLGHRKRISAFLLTPAVGPLSQRFMSSAVGEGSSNIDRVGDVSEILSENTVEVMSSQAPAVNEVAVAAADSALPVAALQYLIDAVHSFTGLNWWAAIAVTTILIRGATLPFLINQLKATYKLNLIRPRLEEIKKKVQETGMDPVAVAEGQKEMNALFKEYGVGPFTPLKGLLIQGPIFISFFFAISNMVEKVPSFKTGGTLWFTDLTTPDSLCLFPVLASLSFLITVECNMQEGLEGNPLASTMKNFSRGIALLAIPFTMGFPKALFCYWITSNLFSLSYGLAIKHPEVRKRLDLPKAPISPANPPHPPSSSASTFQQHSNTVEEQPNQSPNSPNGAARRDAILKQRIRDLEKQLKGRKKNKKI